MFLPPPPKVWFTVPGLRSSIAFVVDAGDQTQGKIYLWATFPGRVCVCVWGGHAYHILVEVREPVGVACLPLPHGSWGVKLLNFFFCVCILPVCI